MTPMIDAIARDIRAQVRWLLAPRYWPGAIVGSKSGLAELHRAAKHAEKNKDSVQLFPLVQNLDEAIRTIRIEIDRDHDGEMIDWLCRNGFGDFLLRSDHSGPMQFMGVDCYIVRHLPPPGWRVINPMAAK